MTANEAFTHCWNGDPADVSAAWFRAAQSLEAFGNPVEARIARLNYIKSLPLQLSYRTFISATGRLIKRTIKSH